MRSHPPLSGHVPNPSIPQTYICVAQWPVCVCGGASTPDYHEYVEGLTWVQPLWPQETISLICLKAAVQQNKSAFWSSGLQCTHTFRAVHYFGNASCTFVYALVVVSLLHALHCIVKVTCVTVSSTGTCMHSAQLTLIIIPTEIASLQV